MMQPAPGRHDQYGRPRFRQDLVAESIEDQGARFVDVMDPDSGNIFRFYEVEYSLACGMDGERDIPGIVKWAQDELGLTPSAQEVRQVIAALGDLGFIEDAAGSELAPGIVVGAPPKPATSPDIGLGGSGAGTAGSPASRSQPAPPASPAPDVALGAAGTSARRPPDRAEDVALGAPGRSPGPGPAAASSSDVSLDLSDHIAVRRSDVQEAVRASKVMAAVDVPQGLLDALEDKPTSKATTFDRPEPPRIPEARPDARIEVRSDGRFEGKPEARPDARIEVKPEARVGKSPLTRQPPGDAGGKPPVELLEPPVPVDQPASTATAGARVSPIIVFLLLAALVGAAGFLIWKYVLEQPSSTAETRVEPLPTPPKVESPPPAPPPPPPPTTKIAMEVPAPDDVTTSRAGTIETILADKSAVKTGDVVVKLVGDKPIEAEIANLIHTQKRLQDLIDASTRRRDAAHASNNKAAEAQAQAEIDTRQKALTTSQSTLATKTVDLDKFLLHAPSNGTFAPLVKLGQKVTANSAVAKVQRDATPIALFTVADGKRFAANASIEVAIGKAEQHVTCTIADAQPTSVKVACPVDPALAEGTEVTLRLPAAAAEPTPGNAAAPAPAPPPTEAPAALPSGGSAATEPPAAKP